MPLGSCESHKDFEFDLSTLIRDSYSHVPSWEKSGIDPIKYAKNVTLETFQLFQLDAAASIRTALDNQAIHGAATTPHEFAVLTIDSIPHLKAAYSINSLVRPWVNDEQGMLTQMCEFFVGGHHSVKPLASRVRSIPPEREPSY